MSFSPKVIQGFFQRKDEEVTIVYNGSFRLLKHIALDILHNNEEADNIVQDTYLKALVSESLYQKNVSFLAWLVTICKNLALNRKRDLEKKATMVSEDKVMVIEEPYHSLELEQIRNLIGKEDYDILMFRLYHGLSFAEIAELFSTTPSSVRGRYHRAVKKVKKAKIL